MAKSEKARGYDGVQGVIALVGITLGVIPLVRVVITGEAGGLFRWIFGPFVQTLGPFAPVLVVVVAVGLIAMLEVMKRRT